jgi:hypothetical protein
MRRAAPRAFGTWLAPSGCHVGGGGACVAWQRYLTYDVPSWVDGLRKDAKTAESHISYDIRVYDELAWRRKPFMFDKQSWDPNTLSTMLKRKLCLGDEHKEYTVIGEAFPFADRNDSPVINEPNFPVRLLWDHQSKTEKVMIQLGEQFPPLLWITVKPTIDALRRVLREFLEVDAQHMKKYLPYYEETQNRIETRHREKFGEALADFKMRDAFTEDMRRKDPMSLTFDWPNTHNILLGTVEHFTLVEDKMMKTNPFVFNWPLLMSEGNHHMEETPMRMAAFRTIYSKSLIMLHTRLDLQVDPRHLGNSDDDHVPVLEVPVMASVNYPEGTRLSGGAGLVQRFNSVMGTSYPDNMPVDILGAFARELSVKSVKELREEVKFLAAAAEKVPEIDRTIRLAPEFSGHNRILGQLAFSIIHLALADDPEFETVFRTYERHPCDMVRVACAKAAQMNMREDLVRQITEREPAGTNAQRLMATCLKASAPPPSRPSAANSGAEPTDTPNATCV